MLDLVRSELLTHALGFGGSCLQIMGDLLPTGIFKLIDGRIEIWDPLKGRGDCTPDDLLELVRLEAMTRSVNGEILGAALITRLSGPLGEAGLGIQIHTRETAEMLVCACSGFRDDFHMAEPEHAEPPIFEDGLCYFLPSALA